MKRSIMLWALVLLAFNAGLLEPREVFGQQGESITLTCEVFPTKPDGRCWDGFGGAPDIQFVAYFRDQGTIVSPVVYDVLKTSFTLHLQSREIVRVEIWDRDLFRHDLILRVDLDPKAPAGTFLYERSWLTIFVN